MRRAQQAVGEALELEAEREWAVVGVVQHALGHAQGERGEARQLVDEAVDGGVELRERDDLGHEAERERLRGRDAAAAHDQVLRAPEPDQARDPLGAAAAGDHAERHLREAELEVVGGDAEVACQRELEPDAERIAVQARDHRLRAALGRGDVPREARQVVRGALEEARDVAARRERGSGAAEHDHAHALVLPELVEGGRELLARRHGDPVQLVGHVERDPREPALRVAAHLEAVVLGRLAHPVPPPFPKRVNMLA